MKIYNEYKTHWVELEKLEEEQYHYGSIHLRVHVKTEHFDSSFTGIWIGLKQVEQFIHELEALDEQRKGEVTLSSLTGDDMQLIVKSVDERGHLALGIRIVKRSNDFGWPDVLQTGFELDPTAIPGIMVHLKKLKREKAAH